MLGALCAARPKPWFLTSLSFFHHGSAAHHRLVQRPLIKPVGFGFGFDGGDRNHPSRRHHSTACCGLGCGSRGGAASIWHAILPSNGDFGRAFHHHHHHEQKGEGSWNVAWDARPARWLHRPDSAWLLFGVCACLVAPPPPFELSDVVNPEADEKSDGGGGTEDIVSSDENEKSSDDDYRVTGVRADGRCLFRAIAHVACLRNGEEAPNEDRQTELADELRTQVVDELLERREETEWFIDGDFDAYVDRMRKPYVWGGEPELLMASHVLETPIFVFMRDRSSGGLISIANYGQEYMREDEIPIKVLFHGYGHYDILETISGQNYQKVEA